MRFYKWSPINKKVLRPSWKVHSTIRRFIGFRGIIRHDRSPGDVPVFYPDRLIVTDTTIIESGLLESFEERGNWRKMEREKSTTFKMLRISLLIIFLSLPSISFSQQPNPKIWEPFGYNSYYNKKIITKSPDILLVWTYKTVTDDMREKRIEEVKKADPAKSIQYRNYHHECFLWEIDCKNRKIMTKEFIDFDKDGKVIDRYRYDDGGWESIISGTGAERLYQKACLPEKIPSKKKK